MRGRTKGLRGCCRRKGEEDMGAVGVAGERDHVDVGERDAVSVCVPCLGTLREMRPQRGMRRRRRERAPHDNDVGAAMKRERDTPAHQHGHCHSLLLVCFQVPFVSFFLGLCALCFQKGNWIAVCMWAGAALTGRVRRPNPPRQSPFPLSPSMFAAISAFSSLPVPDNKRVGEKAHSPRSLPTHSSLSGFDKAFKGQQVECQEGERGGSRGRRGGGSFSHTLTLPPSHQRQPTDTEQEEEPAAPHSSPLPSPPPSFSPLPLLPSTPSIIHQIPRPASPPGTRSGPETCRAP